jgi:hypothetical protein
MYEFVKTEQGWVLYWGAAILHEKREAPKPIVTAAEEKAPLDAREPLTTLSA